ncbi:MAG: PAS domain S-box protein, partial [Chloroflexi bacterium]|nr:PAS domain S-box protein [Chloroflexota bacterium]
MSEKRPSYEELKRRLEQAEAALAALRRGEVDLVMGAKGSLLVRLKSLVEENERLARDWQATFDAANDAIWVIDSEHRILQSNRTAERFFGKPRQELIGRHCWEIVYGVTEPAPECSALRAKQSLRRESMKLLFGNRFFEATTDPILDEEGNYAGAIEIFSDITKRKQAEEEIRRRASELEAVHKVSTALRAAQSAEQALSILLNETLAALQADTGSILLYEPSRGELRPAAARGWFHELAEASTQPGEGIAGTVFSSGEKHISTEFASDPLTRASVRESVPPGWGGACVPIRAAASIIGVLFVSVRAPRQMTDEDVKVLESLAEMAGSALHRMRLHEETQRHVQQLQTLQTIDRAIISAVDSRLTLNILLEQALAPLGADAAGVLLFNPHTLTL